MASIPDAYQDRSEKRTFGQFADRDPGGALRAILDRDDTDAGASELLVSTVAAADRNGTPGDAGGFSNRGVESFERVSLRIRPDVKCTGGGQRLLGSRYWPIGPSQSGQCTRSKSPRSWRTSDSMSFVAPQRLQVGIPCG